MHFNPVFQRPCKAIPTEHFRCQIIYIITVSCTHGNFVNCAFFANLHLLQNISLNQKLHHDRGMNILVQIVKIATMHNMLVTQSPPAKIIRYKEISLNCWSDYWFDKFLRKNCQFISKTVPLQGRRYRTHTRRSRLASFSPCWRASWRTSASRPSSLSWHPTSC